jgi:hypothetical protein
MVVVIGYWFSGTGNRCVALKKVGKDAKYWEFSEQGFQDFEHGFRYYPI